MNVVCRSESEQSSERSRKATASPRPAASKPSSLAMSSSSPAAVPKRDSSPSTDDIPRPSLARCCRY